MNKKPRADSKLNTLPDEQQAAIFEYLASHSPADCVQWLGQHRLATSRAALSVFRSWYALRSQFARNESTVEFLAKKAAEQRVLTPEMRNETGQEFFADMALARRDTNGWVKLQQAEVQRDRLALDRQRFRRQTCELFIQWFEDQRAKDVLEGEWSNAEKIEQLGRQMFGEDWRGTSVTLDPKAPAAEGSKTPS
jgi:hypothetical protein